ncbi:hypothetical protein C8R42DRAFT_712467 [Lentinula raphanica]|nr:hypothetical protein C8R42DRAFT_712467 [Lentinula raphanica]
MPCLLTLTTRDAPDASGEPKILLRAQALRITNLDVLKNRLVGNEAKLNEIAPSKHEERGRNMYGARPQDRLTEPTLTKPRQVAGAHPSDRQQTTSECVLNAEIDTIVSVIGGSGGLSARGSRSQSPFFSSVNVKYPCQSTECPRYLVNGRSYTNCVIVHSEEEVEGSESYTTAKVLFDFNATSDFELSVYEGSTVTVIEHDDGSGWVKVSKGNGSGDGFVPASYLSLENGTGQASN